MKQKAFTVLELLIVIAIVGIIASVLFVPFKKAMERARIAQGWVFSDSLRAALQADMVAWWPLDVIVNGKTPDMYFNQLHGTVVGNPQVVKGIVNDALKFDGVDDYVDAGSNSSLKFGTGNFTIEFWVNPSTSKDWNSIIIRSTGSLSTGYRVYDSNGLIRVVYDGLSGQESPTFASVDLNTWQHVAIVKEGNTVQVYKNGGEKTTHTASQTWNITLDTNLLIGRTTWDAGAYFNGLIDDVRIYSQALPEAEIQQHYAEGLKKHQNLATR